MAITYDKIAASTLGSDTATVTFSSISGSYTDLVLIINGKNTTNDDSYGFQFNSDTATNYSLTGFWGNGTSTGSYRTTNANKIESGRANTENSTTIFNIFNYANTTTHKTTLGRGNTNAYINTHVGLWRSTSAINSITITTNGGYTMASGSTFTLYGILKA